MWDVDFESVTPWPVILLRYQEGWAYDRHHADGADLRSSCSCLKNESVNKMKFVFDLDGTLSFDGVTIDDEIKQVLLRAEEFGHEVAFASARSYRDYLGLLGDPLGQQLVIGLNGGLALSSGAIGI